VTGDGGRPGQWVSLVAGSVLYWEGWRYPAILFSSLAVTGVYVMHHDPETVRRRMDTGEPDPGQRAIVGFPA